MENNPLNFGNPEKEWKDKSNEGLSKRGSPLRVYNSNTILIAFVVVLIAFIGVFYYLSTNNYFKSEVSNNCQQCQICSNVTCGSCVCGNLTCGSSISNATNNVYINKTYTNQS